MKDFKKNVIAWAFILFIAGFAPSVSFAGDFDYSYLDISLVSIDLYGMDGTGIEVEGSYVISEKAFAKLLYTYAEGNDVDVWYDNLFIGGGTTVQLDEKLDLVAEGGLLVSWIETDFWDDSDSGFALRGTLRYMAEDKIEFYGGILITSIWDETDSGLEIGTVILANEKFGIKAGYKTIGDMDTIHIGGRLSF